MKCDGPVRADANLLTLCLQLCRQSHHIIRTSCQTNIFIVHGTRTAAIRITHVCVCVMCVLWTWTVCEAAKETTPRATVRQKQLFVCSASII